MKYGNIDGFVDGTYQVVESVYIDGAYAQYKMDEDAANTTVNDSGYGANGGTASTNTSNLASSGAFEFNGTSEYINIDALQADIVSDTVGSISMWINPVADPGPGQTQGLFTLGDTDSNNIWVFTWEDGQKIRSAMQIAGVTQFIVEASDSMTLDWHHVVMVQNGLVPIFYVDGVAIDVNYDNTTDLTAWFADLSGIDNGRIGCRNFNNQGNAVFYEGQIDDFRYYKYPLTAEQVTEIYNSGTVDEDVVMTAPTNSVTVSGLDGDVDEEYKVYAYFRTDQSSATNFRIALNNDTTYTNYGAQQLNGSNTTVAAWRGQATSYYLYAGSADTTSSYSLCVGILYAKSGFERIFQSNLFLNGVVGGDPETIGYVLSNASSWSNTHDNITSLVFSPHQGNFAVGTRIIVMKKVVALEAMNVGNVEVQGKYQQEPAGLYAHYKLNEISGTTVYDCGKQQASSGNGTANVDASTLTAAGKIDRCFDFNGSSEYVSIDSLATNAASDTKGSIAFWMNIGTLTDGVCMFSLQDASTTSILQLNLYDVSGSKYLYFSVRLNSGTFAYQARGNTILSADTWYHVACVQDGVQMRLYLNGVLETLTEVTSTTPGVWLSSLSGLDRGRIANYQNNGSGSVIGPFVGKIEDVRYYNNQALSPQDIQQIYEIGEPPAKAVVTGMWEKIREWRNNTPYAWYLMEDNAASTTVVDSGSGGNNGTSSTNTTNLTTTGKIGNGFDFTATSSERIDVDALATDIASDDVGSFCAWVTSDLGSGSSGRVFMVSDASAESGVALFRSSTGYIFDVRSSNVNYYRIVFPLTVSIGTWQHWAVVQDGTAVKIYLDGEDITSTGTQYVNGTGGADKWMSFCGGIDAGNIGRYEWNSSSGEYWDGKMDDFRYYRRPLSAYEVSEIYNEGNGTQAGSADVTPDSISITGLNGDADVLYKLVMKGVSSGSSSNPFMRINNGYSFNAYYGRQIIEGNNATLSASRTAGDSQPYVGFRTGQFTATGDITLVESMFFAPSSFPKVGICKYMVANSGGTTVALTKLEANVYSRLEKLTSLQIVVLTGAFAPESYIELWRLKV